MTTKMATSRNREILSNIRFLPVTHRVSLLIMHLLRFGSPTIISSNNTKLILDHGLDLSNRNWSLSEVQHITLSD